MLNPVNDTFIEAVTDELGEDILRPVEPSYLEEPRGLLQGTGGALALPRRVEEVSTLIRLANTHRIGVVPYGGGTGLVGAQVMPDGPAPLILSLERMNAIRAVHPEENVMITEAGVILETVQEAAREAGRLFPLSLASQGSCRIGGNLSTNAGGLNTLRYGNARELCLGLEAVLPSGEIWHGLSRLRKDNTGYDLRHLLMGAEGTLGVITAAALKLSPLPQQHATAMLAVRDPAAAVELLALAHTELGEVVSTFELIHGTGLQFLSERMPQVRQPLADQPEWSVLIDIGTSGGMEAEAALEAVFMAAHEAGLVSDGVIAQSESQRAELWAVREQIPEANRLVGAIVSTDISVPISRIPEMIARSRVELDKLGDVRINSFGHVGDGNLHLNVFPAKGRVREDYANIKAEVARVIYDLTAEMEGSFSAEHGIGRVKPDELERYADPTKLASMRAIKAALDPNGIMNPGAVLND